MAQGAELRSGHEVVVGAVRVHRGGGGRVLPQQGRGRRRRGLRGGCGLEGVSYPAGGGADGKEAGCQGAGKAARGAGARGAGGAGLPLLADGGIAAQRGRADGAWPGGRGRGQGRGRGRCWGPPVPRFLRGALMEPLLPRPALHVVDVFGQEGPQQLARLVSQLLMQGEGLDGQRGGPLVLAVPNHLRGRRRAP